MLDSGNFVDIRFGQVPRYKKPVGIYWLQAATTAIAGHVETSPAATTPDLDLSPAVAAGRHRGGLADLLVRAALFGAEAGLLAALLLGFSVLLTAEATIATTDAVLLAAVMGMQGVLLRLYRARAAGGAAVSTRLVMWGWAALPLGILVKGPVLPAWPPPPSSRCCAWDWRAKTGMSLDLAQSHQAAVRACRWRC